MIYYRNVMFQRPVAGLHRTRRSWRNREPHKLRPKQLPSGARDRTRALLTNPMRRIGATARGLGPAKKTPGQTVGRGSFSRGVSLTKQWTFNPPNQPELRTKNLGQRYPPSGGRTGKASPVGVLLPVEQHHAESRDREGERQDQSHNQKLAFRMHHARILRATNPVATRLAGDCLPVE